MVQIVEEDIVQTDRACVSKDIQGPRLLLRASLMKDRERRRWQLRCAQSRWFFILIDRLGHIIIFPTVHVTPPMLLILIICSPSYARAQGSKRPSLKGYQDDTVLTYQACAPNQFIQDCLFQASYLNVLGMHLSRNCLNLTATRGRETDPIAQRQSYDKEREGRGSEVAR